MLESLLGSAKKEKILLFLYTHEEAYAREIATVFNFHLSPVQNQLFNMEKGGLLYSKLKGRIRFFGLNPRYPFKKELDALLEKALTFIPESEKMKYYQPRLRPRHSGKP